MTPRKKRITFNPKVSDEYECTSQVIIHITEDKLRLCLIENCSKMEKRRSWVAPFGIFVTILFTLVTSDFKDFGLSADTWRAIFVLTALISFIWFAYSCYQGRKSVKIEEIIHDLKEKY